MAKLEKLGDIINLQQVLEKMKVLSDKNIKFLGIETNIDVPADEITFHPSRRDSDWDGGVVHSQKEPLAGVAGGPTAIPPFASAPVVPPPIGCVSTTELHPNRKRKKFYIYVLDCEPANTGNVYVGQTDNISDRIWQHIAGIGAYFTMDNKPCDLLHLEVRYSRKDALKREKELIDYVSAGIRFETDIPFEFLIFFDELKREASKHEFNHLFDIRRHHFPIPHVKEWC